MARKLTRRQRLKRDPANQPRGKFIAWVRRNAHVVERAYLPGLLRVSPRIVWRKHHLPKGSVTIDLVRRPGSAQP